MGTVPVFLYRSSADRVQRRALNSPQRRMGPQQLALNDARFCCAVQIRWLKSGTNLCVGVAGFGLRNTHPRSDDSPTSGERLRMFKCDRSQPGQLFDRLSGGRIAVRASLGLADSPAGLCVDIEDGMLQPRAKVRLSRCRPVVVRG